MVLHSCPCLMNYLAFPLSGSSWMDDSSYYILTGAGSLVKYGTVANNKTIHVREKAKLTKFGSYPGRTDHQNAIQWATGMISLNGVNKEHMVKRQVEKEFSLMSFFQDSSQEFDHGREAFPGRGSREAGSREGSFKASRTTTGTGKAAGKWLMRGSLSEFKLFIK
ncbi:hypothetical protein DSO57_1007881 [Entomophthora muscae]|uniref:Uncharacterized protein n=1 Tax=Entomophthora muscae TaxID=34485 RepID=A0ACC2SK48_9FUNG|nr:hypothetical protein DSO57_1007881 [Entomophthora muscae]